MAKSGSYTSSINSWSRLRLDWRTISQDLAANTSLVEAKLFVVFDDNVSSSVQKSASISINGSGGNYQFTIGSLPSGGQVLAGTRVVTVPHNPDGSKTVELRGDAALNLTLSGVYVGTVSVTGSPMLDAIPRGSTIHSVSSPVAVDGVNAVTVVIDRVDPGFTHTVEFSIGSYSQKLYNVATTTSFVIPVEWLNAIPNAVTGSAAVKVTTFSGEKVIGTSVAAPFVISAPASVVPSIGDLSATRIDNAVPSGWGVYVQNQSEVLLEIIGATGVHGSTIRSYKIYGDNLAATTASTTVNLPNAGERKFTAVVIDSRGRSSTKSITLTVEAWAAVALTEVLLGRGSDTAAADDNGSYGRLRATYSAASVAGKNTVTRLVEYRLKGAASWTPAGRFNNGVYTAFGAGNISPNSQYDVRVTVSDMFSRAEFNSFISTAFVTLDFKSGGRGIAFGKVSETDNLFESDFRARFNKGIVVEPWRDAVLGNGWLNYGTGFAPARYYKDPFGVVHLSGMVKSGTLSAAAFTLPAGYRPDFNLIRTGGTYGGGGATRDEATCRVNIQTTGAVIPAQGASQTWVSLEGLSFRVAL